MTGVMAEKGVCLEVSGVAAAYGQSLVLRGVDVVVPKGELVCLMGRNGVGKTTTVKTVVGLMGAVHGTVRLNGEDLTRAAPEVRARAGIGYVPQGRDIFPGLTVWENLQLSMVIHGTRKTGQLERVFELFPVLKEMLKRKGGVLSGGQQQQLAIGRALLTEPKLLIFDEPTEGIQPSIIDQIEDAILALKEELEISILLVEQYVDFARAVADQFCIMERGKVVKSGAIGVLDDETVKEYLTV